MAKGKKERRERLDGNKYSGTVAAGMDSPAPEQEGRLVRGVWICKDCKNFQTVNGTPEETTCKHCGRTYDRRGKELTDRPRTVQISTNYQVSTYRREVNGEQVISAKELGPANFFYLNEQEARALKKFLSEVYK
jgi:hypothetical protein